MSAARAKSMAFQEVVIFMSLFAKEVFFFIITIPASVNK